jgi:hypothetical protein
MQMTTSRFPIDGRRALRWVALAGIVAAVGAITLWRGYLQSARDPASTDH